MRVWGSGEGEGGDIPEHERNETNGDHEKVEQVETISTEALLVEDEPIGDDLEAKLQGEDGGEKVVEVIEYLERNIVTMTRNRMRRAKD